jgi:hypothetical protein
VTSDRPIKEKLTVRTVIEQFRQGARSGGNLNLIIRGLHQRHQPGNVSGDCRSEIGYSWYQQPQADEPLRN